ncbi:MAG TPA: NUDIX domain-containing protein [Micromonosporaceae bacterium]
MASPGGFGSFVHPWQVTSLIQHGHCSYCGAAYLPDQPWPRVCPNCGETTWRNPLPVSVLLLPVRYDDGGHDGVVLTRRAIEPALGELNFPGGFLEYGELWSEGAVRELREETGLVASVDEVTLFDVQSTGRHVLVFGIVPPRRVADLPASQPTAESIEWIVVRERTGLAFPSHQAVLDKFFPIA